MWFTKEFTYDDAVKFVNETKEALEKETDTHQYYESGWLETEEVPRYSKDKVDRIVNIKLDTILGIGLMEKRKGILAKQYKVPVEKISDQLVMVWFDLRGGYDDIKQEEVSCEIYWPSYVDPLYPLIHQYTKDGKIIWTNEQGRRTSTVPTKQQWIKYLSMIDNNERKWMHLYLETSDALGLHKYKNAYGEFKKESKLPLHEIRLEVLENVLPFFYDNGYTEDLLNLLKLMDDIESAKKIASNKIETPTTIPTQELSYTDEASRLMVWSVAAIVSAVAISLLATL